MESFRPNQPLLYIYYIQNHTKTLYELYPLNHFCYFVYINPLSSSLKVSFTWIFFSVVTLIFHIFFFNILCLCIFFIYFYFLYPCVCVTFCEERKLLDTMFDSRVFTNGVNAKRNLEVTDATKVSWFFYSHVWHFSFVGRILWYRMLFLYYFPLFFS